MNNEKKLKLQEEMFRKSYLPKGMKEYIKHHGEDLPDASPYYPDYPNKKYAGERNGVFYLEFYDETTRTSVYNYDNDTNIYEVCGYTIDGITKMGLNLINSMDTHHGHDISWIMSTIYVSLLMGTKKGLFLDEVHALGTLIYEHIKKIGESINYISVPYEQYTRAYWSGRDTCYLSAKLAQATLYALSLDEAAGTKLLSLDDKLYGIRKKFAEYTYYTKDINRIDMNLFNKYKCYELCNKAYYEQDIKYEPDAALSQDTRERNICIEGREIMNLFYKLDGNKCEFAITFLNDVLTKSHMSKYKKASLLRAVKRELGSDDMADVMIQLSDKAKVIALELELNGDY